MGLGSLVAGARAHGSLKQLLRQWKESRVEDPMTLDSYVRASSISSLCAREEVLRFKHGVTRKVVHDADDLLIFLHGTALHWALQNRALPNVKALYGIWECLSCGNKHGSVEAGRPISDTVILRPDKCSKCGRVQRGPDDDAFRYVEHHFINDEYRITGHCDGFLVIPGLPGMGVLEAKSAGGRSAWEVQHAPNIGHAIQAHVYMWFADLHWAKLLYWVKGENGLVALKEHHIERDEETIGKVKAMLTSIKLGVSGDKVIPQRVCAVSDCPRAKLCSVRKICFESDHTEF